MTLDTETITALALEISRASLTAADSLIAESTEGWPAEFKATIPALGESTQSQRFEAFLANRANAERAIEKDIQDDARRKSEFAEIVRRHQEADAATIETNIAHNKAALAVHDAQSLTARQQGFNAPPEPAMLPETPEALQYAEMGNRYKQMF